MNRQELEKLRKQTQKKKDKPPCQIDKTEQKYKERQKKIM